MKQWKTGQKEIAITATGKNRIMIFGPKNDGTYIVEFKTDAGEARMPYGLVVPDVS
jgi:hypothetical protein